MTWRTETVIVCSHNKNEFKLNESVVHCIALYCIVLYCIIEGQSMNESLEHVSYKYKYHIISYYGIPRNIPSSTLPIVPCYYIYIYIYIGDDEKHNATLQ